MAPPERKHSKRPAKPLVFCGANTTIEHSNCYRRNLFHDHNPTCQNNLIEKFKCKRTYENAQHYYIVLKPYTRYNSKECDFVRIEKNLRRRFKYDRILITREILAKRIHYNILITSGSNICSIHDKTFTKNFKANVQLVDKIEDLPDIIKYMTKEADERQFKPDLDRFYYLKE